MPLHFMEQDRKEKKTYMMAEGPDSGGILIFIR